MVSIVTTSIVMTSIVMTSIRAAREKATAGQKGGVP